MSFDVEEFVIYRIANAPIREYPVPHVYIRSVFPDDFYASLRRHWPATDFLVPIDETGNVRRGRYRERFVMPVRGDKIERLPPEAREFWTSFSEWLFKGPLLRALLRKFGEHIGSYNGCDVEQLVCATESLIVRDHTNYSLGPHTDAPFRLLSLLFYCPDDDARKHLGTSLYAPADPAFRCRGGPHYPRDGFHRIATMEYRPNTLFAFVKTDNSFHGVEPVDDADVQRDLLLYDIRANPPAAAEPAQEQASASSLGLRMLKTIFGARK
jgi:hypothetical protein